MSAIWPERDLVYMVTGTDGFRAYVVNPLAPSITIHRDCRASGFATNVYSPSMKARCFKYRTDGTVHRLVVGSAPGLLVDDPTLNVFTVAYPFGLPDRARPDLPIQVTHETALLCSRWKPVYNLDIRPSGFVAVATSAGVGLFHLSWIPALNQMTDFAAWNCIRVPPEAYAPWWSSNWAADMADASFIDDSTLYVVKATDGVWRLSFQPDPTNYTHRCMATAYYPGVTCGMNVTVWLHGWANPDIPTLHHPYAVVADGDTAYVTGWSGKVQRLGLVPGTGARIHGIDRDRNNIDLLFSSPFWKRVYQVEASPSLTPPRWEPEPSAQVRGVGGGEYTARVTTNGTASRTYRIRISP